MIILCKKLFRSSFINYVRAYYRCKITSAENFDYTECFHPGILKHYCPFYGYGFH